MNAALPPAFANLSEGRVLRAFGEEIIIHLDSESTGGKLNVWTELTPPAGGPPPHYHENEDEWFVVQEGRVEFFSDGKWTELTTAPGGFDRYFARCAEEFAKGGAPDMERIVAISAEHGIHFVT